MVLGAVIVVLGGVEAAAEGRLPERLNAHVATVQSQRLSGAEPAEKERKAFCTLPTMWVA